MDIQHPYATSSRRGIPRLIPGSIGVLIVAVFLALLGRAVNNSRNAAMSATTA